MNLEEIRVFRVKQGKLPDEIGIPNNYTANEFKWIPFLGSNPDGEKPSTYRGIFSFAHEEVGQTRIECSGTRVNGMLEISISGDERTAGYFGVAAHRFAETIFDTTTVEIKGMEEQLEDEVEMLKKELSKIHEKNEKLESKIDKFKEMLE
tara:strand:+ start:4234 stop:4683 length:450 start_codon:yes stop_codon:yes gene_type:complete